MKIFRFVLRDVLLSAVVLTTTEMSSLVPRLLCRLVRQSTAACHDVMHSQQVAGAEDV